MEHDQSTTWLDAHLADDGRWADVGDSQLVQVTVPDLAATEEAVPTADAVPTTVGESWLVDAVVGFEAEVDQIVVDGDAIAAIDVMADPAFDPPAPAGGSGIDPSIEDGILDPFDLYLADPAAGDPMTASGSALTSDADAVTDTDDISGSPSEPDPDGATIDPFDAEEGLADAFDGPEAFDRPEAVDAIEALDGFEPHAGGGGSLDAFDEVDWPDAPDVAADDGFADETPADPFDGVDDAPDLDAF